MSTPPPTTDDGETMPPPSLTTSARALLHPLPPLTIIVATTPITTTPSPSPIRRHRRCLGIGHAGTLPWPRIKTDMAFFSRVTTRAPPPPQPPTSPTSQNAKCTSAVNAVIMGRKTYDSLPTRFRPLPGRVNVVVTRDGSGRERARIEGEWRAARERERQRERERERKNSSKEGGATPSPSSTTPRPDLEPETGTETGLTTLKETPDVLVATSLESAVAALYDAFRTTPTPGPLSHNSTRRLANIFIIGGGEIYGAALNLKLKPDGGEQQTGANAGTMRIVMTDVRRCPAPASAPDPALSSNATATAITTVGEQEAVVVENSVNGFECDTFFPLDSEELEQSGDYGDGEGGWRKVSAEDVSSWVGEEVKGGWVREGEVVLRVLGFERRA
ncbi:hypothetical protein GX51_01033 [Blastomyces parvus]|uniref:Dihydrofolate reductase n=1 Tax=Blastomyces parvus TaxID=2060905 RepID=A0A2B7XIM5_9EURO|nr:hypothetical protein GX51_01033 [Blastomyces parvus]